MRRVLWASEVALWVTLDALEWVDGALCRTPLYARPRALVLDTLLGPAEDFEFVPRTTPMAP